MQILKKVKKDNTREIYFCGIKLFSYKREKKQKYNAFEYTKKYLYVLDNFKKEETSKVSSNYIWQLWFQGEDKAPQIVQQCLKSIKKYCSSKNIIVLNENTIENYIEIAPHIKQKYEQGIIPKAHYSDYIRVCLLAKYGGIWIDATVLLTAPIPKEIQEAEFFQFKSVTWYLFPKIISKKTILAVQKMKTYLKPHHSGSSWFMVAKSNCIIMQVVKELLEEYWRVENKLVNYFLFHDFLAFAILNNEDCRRIYNDMYSLNNRNPHVLQDLLKDKYDEELFNEIKQFSSIHKLTYKIPEKDINEDSFFKYILHNFSKTLAGVERE